MFTFGPVPSRRLGQSLGINNIPPKYCSYACVYCQLGRAIRLVSAPEEFYLPAQVFGAVQNRLDILREAGKVPDYLTIVADGEPTLDVHLGELIDALQRTNVPVAVITNGTLLHVPQVRAALSGADWVSVKIDSVDENTWRRMDRPAKGLNLDEILHGIDTFAAEFPGTLVTETMLVSDCNTAEQNLDETARYIAKLNPKYACLSAPVRPPAETWVEVPSPEICIRAFNIFSSRIERVEYLLGYEGNAFAHTDDPVQDILSITAVHPMREDALEELLQHQGADFSLVDNLVQQGILKCTRYEGNRFYARVLHRN